MRGLRIELSCDANAVLQPGMGAHLSQALPFLSLLWGPWSYRRTQSPSAPVPELVAV